MDFFGSYMLLADRLTVWRALNDASVLKLAIPGCHRIEWVSATSLEVKIKVNLGFVHPVFAGELELSDVEPATSYTLSGKGRGAVLGLARGAASVSLRDVNRGAFCQGLVQSIRELNQAEEIDGQQLNTLEEITLLRFCASGGASPKIMALGKKLVGASAQKVIDRFFVRFARAMQTKVYVLPPDYDVSDLSPSPLLDRT